MLRANLHNFGIFAYNNMAPNTFGIFQIEFPLNSFLCVFFWNMCEAFLIHRGHELQQKNVAKNCIKNDDVYDKTRIFLYQGKLLFPLLLLFLLPLFPPCFFAILTLKNVVM